jgi:hypothetical protein
MRARLASWTCVAAATLAAAALVQCRRAAPGDWMGFAPYPGTRELCQQRVYGESQGRRVEIHWRSFATRDSPTDVIAFYARREGRKAERSGDTLEVHHGADHNLSVYPASKTDIPSCDSRPNSEERTVILVSLALR